jgi:hypothetical protein
MSLTPWNSIGLILIQLSFAFILLKEGTGKNNLTIGDAVFAELPFYISVIHYDVLSRIDFHYVLFGQIGLAEEA